MLLPINKVQRPTSTLPTSTEAEPSHMKPLQKFKQWYQRYLQITPLETGEQSVATHYADQVVDPSHIFKVGEVAFKDKAIPKGMTREQIYRIMLEKQDNYLKAEILRQLDITPEEFAHYAKKISADHEVFTQNLKKQKIEIEQCRSEFFEPRLLQYLEKIYGPEDAQDLSDIQIIYDMNATLHDGSSGGYGEKNMIVIRPQRINAAYDCEAFQKTPFFHTFLNTEVLYHELSHVRHQDEVFANLFDALIVIAQGDAVAIAKPRHGENVPKHISPAYYPLAYKKPVGLKRIAKAEQLLKQWNKFHEYRADFESMFVLKETEEYKQRATALGNTFSADGYPKNYGYLSGYSKRSLVNYQEDFHAGVFQDQVIQKTRHSKSSGCCNIM